MPGSFLDTTVVIDISDRATINTGKAEQHIKKNQPAQAPYYALKELLAGHIRILCETHNILLAANNPAEALTALLNRSPAEGRKKEARIKILAASLNKAFNTNLTDSRSEIKRELLQDIAIRVNGLWRKSHAMHSVNLVQALACFNDGKISYGNSGELIAPQNTFNCIAKERCAAAEYLYDDKISLEKLINSLHPDNLDPTLANKNENKQRRKALKELMQNGPKKFNRGRCRGIGDAYFAAMCPPGLNVLTTNIEDHVLLCTALSKKAVAP